MGAVAADVAFPVDVLEGCETALVVFAAAFGGVQDAAYVREAGLNAVCVDTDAAALARMRYDYPDDWLFVAADAFGVADEAAGDGSSWDVVTLDPFTGSMMDRTIERLPDFCKLARKYVICGIDNRRLTPPDGWRERSRFWRSDLKGGVYWAVLERA